MINIFEYLKNISVEKLTHFYLISFNQIQTGEQIE